MPALQALERLARAFFQGLSTLAPAAWLHAQSVVMCRTEQSIFHKNFTI